MVEPSQNNEVALDFSARNEVIVNLSASNDPLFLSSGDHPGMSLTAEAFDGSNFAGWSRSARRALGAKHKLGFVDESCSKLAANSPNFQA